MKLSPEQIQDKLQAYQGWVYQDERIFKTYKFADYETVLKLVNSVAMMAENLDHHPDITFGFGYATFSLTSHEDGGVTVKDIALAGEIEKSAAMV
jgi:4a-hydroxytetrahydrobiopterin dehydratase